MKKIDSVSQWILDFLKDNEWNENISLKNIQDRVGLDHPQKVVHRLQQLEKKWHLRKQDNWTYKVFDKPVKGVASIPMYGFAQCGNKWSAIVDEYPIERIEISTSFLGVSDEENYFFVKAKGDSMKPQIQDGDLLFIRKLSGGRNEWDKLFVVHNWNAKIKIVKKMWWKYFLVSLNQDYYDLEILSTDDVDVVGIVKKVIKNF